MTPTVGSLFSGIGGFDLGFERAGFRVQWQVENHPYCQRVLARHWPEVPRYDDVTTLDWTTLQRVDCLIGGFPCQPVSVAGKRRAQADPRWLWPSFVRAIALLRPPVVCAENVPGLRTAGLRDVLADLARLGFDAEWTTLSAADVGAPHLRKRLFLVATDADRAELRLEPGWFGRALRAGAAQRGEHGDIGDVADPNGERQLQSGRREPAQRRWLGDGGESVADTECDGWEGAEYALPREGTPALRRRPADPGRWAPEPDVGRVAHGIPARVDRLRGLGNAIVPQKAERVGRVIRQHLFAS